MVLWLAEKFLAEGRRVAISSARLSRGTDPGTSDEIEPVPPPSGRPGAVRCRRGLLRQRLRPRSQPSLSTFLLDDGFQHFQLARDVNILLMVDASLAVGFTPNEDLLPAGSLREPLSAMTRADILIFTRAETQPGVTAAVTNLSSYPVFAASRQAPRFSPFRRHQSVTLQSTQQIGSGCLTRCKTFCATSVIPRQFFAIWKTGKFPSPLKKTSRESPSATLLPTSARSKIPRESAGGCRRLSLPPKKTPKISLPPTFPFIPRVHH